MPLSYDNCPRPRLPIGPGLKSVPSMAAAEWQASTISTNSPASTSRSQRDNSSDETQRGAELRRLQVSRAAVRWGEIKMPSLSV